jgi:branched-chain amino acid transport system substrate-binding protein
LSGRSRRFASALALSAALALACETPVLPTRDRQDYSHAVETMARDEEAGIAELRGFVSQHPRSDVADDAALRLADALIARGETREATEQLVWALRNHPEGDRSDELRLRLATLQRERGQPDAAYRTAREIRLSLLSAETRRVVHRLLADLAGEAGRPGARLRWLAQVRAGLPEGEGRMAVDREIDVTLAAMSTEELQQTAEQLGRRVPAGRVRLRQAELLLEAGDSEGAEYALDIASRLPLAPGDAERLALLDARLAGAPDIPGVFVPGDLPDGARVQGTLGVVLPLSGPLAGPGESALDGIVLAAGIFRSQPFETRSGGLRLLVRDSRGDPRLAAEAVRMLAADPEVLAIVGPLTAREAEAAALEADQGEVPLLTLTRHQDVAVGRPWTFRLGLTPRDEVELLAEYAVHGLGVRSAAILYPRDEYGLRLRALFWDALERRGGQVTGVAAYDVEATDFAEPIRKLIGFQLLSEGQNAALARRQSLRETAKRRPPKAARELRAAAANVTGPGGSPLPPFRDFDAVFIPDSHENVGLIAPALAFHDVRGVRLLGASGWNHAELLSLGGVHVEGAVFTGAVAPASSSPVLAHFAGRYETAYGRAPDDLSATAFDSTLLLIRELLAGRADRAGLREGLLTAQPLAGVSGAISLAGDGDARRRPHLLGVEGGEILSVDGLGRSPWLPGVSEPPPTDEEVSPLAPTQ